MKNKKCNRDVICHICKEEFHSLTSDEKKSQEHIERSQIYDDYDLQDDTVEVCDHCFKKIMFEKGL